MGEVWRDSKMLSGIAVVFIILLHRVAADAIAREPFSICVTAYNLTMSVPVKNSDFAWQGHLPIHFHETIEYIPHCETESESSYMLTKSFLTQKISHLKPAFTGTNVRLSSKMHKRELMNTAVLKAIPIMKEKQMGKHSIYSLWNFLLKDVALVRHSGKGNSLIAMVEATSFFPWPDGASSLKFKDVKLKVSIHLPTEDVETPPKVKVMSYPTLGNQDYLKSFDFVLRGQNKINHEELDKVSWTELVFTTEAINMEVPTARKLFVNISAEVEIPEEARAKLATLPNVCFDIFHEEKYTPIWQLFLMVLMLFVGMQPFFVLEVFTMHKKLGGLCVLIIGITKLLYFAVLCGFTLFFVNESMYRTCYVLFTDDEWFPFLQYLFWTLGPSVNFIFLAVTFSINVYGNKNLNEITDDLIASYLGKEGRGKWNYVSPLIYKALPPVVVIAVMLFHFKLFFFDINLIGQFKVMMFAGMITIPLWFLRIVWNKERRIPHIITFFFLTCVPTASFLARAQNY